MWLGIDELIGSVRWTLREKVAPGVEDSLTQSYLRTVDALLSQIARRIEHEPAALAAEVQDLREVLPQVAAASGDARVRREIEAALQKSQNAAPGFSALLQSAQALREALARAMPGLDGSAREAVRGYLARQLKRNATFMPEPTGVL